MELAGDRIAKMILTAGRTHEARISALLPFFRFESLSQLVITARHTEESTPGLQIAHLLREGSRFLGTIPPIFRSELLLRQFAASTRQ